MGVKFGREYEDIVKDLTAAIRLIDDAYDFFEMSLHDWESLDEEEQTACLTTLADDIFFALGQSPQISVGRQGKLSYHASRHVITVSQGERVTIVKLIE